MKKVFVILLSLISLVSFAKGAEVLNWKECVKEAAKNNPSLAASLQSIEQSKAQKWIATSPMLPQISAESGVNKSNSFSGNSEKNKYDYSVQGEQLIFDGFKTYNDVKSAKEDITAAKFNNALISSEVRYNLKTAFVDLLRAQSMVSIAQDIIQRRKQNYEMIGLSYESGREHEGSLLLAKADLQKAQFDLKKAERDVSVARYALRKVMGWEKNTPVTVKGEFRLSLSSKDEPNLEALANKHPQVKMSEAEKNSAKYGVGSAKAEFFPEINLNARAGKVGVGISSDDKGWTVGLGASLPIFEGGRRIANTQKAHARLNEAVYNEKSDYDAVLSTLEESWQTFQDAIEEVSVQQSYLEAAKVRAKISRAQYANGLLIFDNWIIIEDNYVNAEKNYLNSEANMLRAEALWVKAKGGALDYE
ncbi:MAG: TolC family protein [Pseudomonadota bacterium]